MNIQDVVKSGNYLVLDTETTGIKYGSEILEIAVIDSTGSVQINTRVKPKGAIPSDATRIHGISGRDVSGCPTWVEVREKVREVLKGREVIIYNAEYDLKMLRSSDGNYQIKEGWGDFNAYCAMLAYAEHAKVWNDYRQSWAWHKLSEAIRREKLAIRDAHSALGDVQMTLALCQKVWGVKS